MVMLDLKSYIGVVFEGDENVTTVIPAAQSPLIHCVLISVISISSKV